MIHKSALSGADEQTKASVMSPQFSEKQSLYGSNGQRKYINADERKRLLHEAQKAGGTDPLIHTLCEMLVYTGCRISEALSLTTSSIYLSEGVVVIHSLKKRDVYVIRHVPIPDDLLVLLEKVHSLQAAKAFNEPRKLWPWHRVTAYHKIKRIMTAANINGIQACPHGLRHGFGVHAIGCGVPLNLVQRWLGHADLSTTAIYLNVVGKEEREVARKMWSYDLSTCFL